MKQQILSWNTFTLAFYLIVHVSFQQKKCVYIKKMSSDSEKLVVLDLMNNIYYSKTKNKTKKSKDQNASIWRQNRKTEKQKYIY